MKIKYQIATLFALLGVMTACSSESTPTYSDLGSDTYPQKFYVEYVPCTGGPDYSPEAFAETMLPAVPAGKFIVIAPEDVSAKNP